jgi:hypothetical protein
MMQKQSCLGTAILAMFLFLILGLFAGGGNHRPPIEVGQPRSKVCTYSFPIGMYCR